MYVPRHFALEDLEEIRSLVRDVHVGQLVTVGDDVRPTRACPLGGRRGRRASGPANEHWRRIVDGSPGLVVVTGPDAYITPRWYASKREHGRVVPTWNYSAVHLTGPVTVHDDWWLRQAVTRLTDHHEGRSTNGDQWQVEDAPERFVTGQRAIVGVSMTVTASRQGQVEPEPVRRGPGRCRRGLAGSADLGAAAVRDAMVRRQQGH